MNYKVLSVKSCGRFSEANQNILINISVNQNHINRKQMLKMNEKEKLQNFLLHVFVSTKGD